MKLISKISSETEKSASAHQIRAKKREIERERKKRSDSARARSRARTLSLSFSFLSRSRERKKKTKMSFFSDDELEELDLAQFDSMVETATNRAPPLPKTTTTTTLSGERGENEGFFFAGAGIGGTTNAAHVARGERTKDFLPQEEKDAEFENANTKKGAHITSGGGMKQRSIAQMFATNATTTDGSNNNNNSNSNNNNNNSNGGFTNERVSLYDASTPQEQRQPKKKTTTTQTTKRNTSEKGGGTQLTLPSGYRPNAFENPGEYAPRVFTANNSSARGARGDGNNASGNNIARGSVLGGAMTTELQRKQQQRRQQFQQQQPVSELDLAAAQTYIYPAQVSRREYQYAIAANALLNNTLVCLPTGLGKTLIAAVVMLNYKRWFPNGKVIFVAPTRPLVDQQMQACHDICGIPSEETVVLMGSTKKKGKTVADSRREHWMEKKVFFCTPQVVSNDIETGDLNAKDVVCLVVDEAHRAVGNYAYTQIVTKLKERGAVFRILALTATPGKELENVQNIVSALDINRIEFRSESDVDVAKYTFRRDLLVEPIGQDDVSKGILTLLKDSMKPHLKLAMGFGAFSNNNSNHGVPGTVNGLGYNVKRFLELPDADPPAFFPLQQVTQFVQRGQIQTRNKDACGHSLRHATYIAHIIDLFTRFGASQAYEYIMKDRPHATILSDKYVQFKEACEQIRSLASNGAKHSPKLQKLVKIVAEQFSNNSSTISGSGEKRLTDFFSSAKGNGESEKNSEDEKKKRIDDDTRVMIFCSYRDTVRDIVEQLREIKPNGENACRVKVAPFVGQGSGENARDRRNREKQVLAQQQQNNNNNKGGGGDGAADTLIFEKQKGQKQAEQKAVLEDFRNGNLNCLVATSIGEEGLDIPSVDLIVFYDVVDVIRTVQRMGRTGRARDGRVVVLATRGKEHTKFTAELKKYEDLKSKLRTPDKCLVLCNDTPRMIPDDIFPSCELICIESTSKKEKNGAKSRTGASLAKRTKQQQEYKARKYTSTSTLIFDANPAKQYQALDIGNRSILVAYEEQGGDEMRRKAAAAAAATTMTSSSLLVFEEEEQRTHLQEMKDKGFAGSLPYQCRYQKVYNFEHGTMTKFLVRAMSKLQGIARSPSGLGGSTDTSADDFDEEAWCGDAIAGGAVSEKRQNAQRIRDGVNLRVNEGVDIDEYDRQIFPLHPTDAEDEDNYGFGAGADGVDDKLPMIINDDEDDSFENNGIIISSDIEDDDDFAKAAPKEENEEEKVVENVPPTGGPGTHAEEPISFSDDEEEGEEDIDVDVDGEKKSEREEEEEEVPVIGTMEPKQEEENDDDEVIIIQEKESPPKVALVQEQPQKSPSAAEAARMRFSSTVSREPTVQPSLRKNSVDAAPILSRVSLETENQELVEKTLDHIPLNILKEHVQFAREKAEAAEEQRRRSVSMPPPDPRVPRTNSSKKKKNLQQQQQGSFPSDESLRFKRRRREKVSKEPSPVHPVAPALPSRDIAAHKRREKVQHKKPLKKKSAFLDDMAGGEGDDDDDMNYQDYDSDDARFIDDASPETGYDAHHHHPQYFSSAGNTDGDTNNRSAPFTCANASGNPYTQPTPMVNLGETFARFGPRNRQYNVQDTPPDSSMENHTQTTDEYEDSFINDDEIDYETEEDDGALPSVRKPDKEKKKKKRRVLVKKANHNATKKRMSDDSMSLSDPAMIAKFSDFRHGVVSTLPSNSNTQEKEEQKEGEEAHERNVPDVLDDEFEDDWNKGNSDDDDW